MSLEAQIALLTVPQEFCRLCNALLRAEHGDDFLPIDDDQADAGNDGYLKPERRMFAMHCFKRVQNQLLEQAIRRKMTGDLGKVIALKNAGLWEIQAWTFLSNYPVPESIGRDIVLLGGGAGIDVSWRGPAELAVSLQRHPEVHERFPALQVTEVSAKLGEIHTQVGALARELVPAAEDLPFIPRTPEHQALLIASRSDFWEYRLFASVLAQGRESLELKYLDHTMRIAPHRVEMGFSPARDLLSEYFNRMGTTVDATGSVFDETAQTRAFGPPGEPGNAQAIHHLALRILGMYEGFLDAAAEVRAVTPPALLAQLFESAHRYSDAPIAQVRRFVDDAISEFERLPEYVDRGTPVVIDLVLELAVDQAVQAELDAETRRVRRKVKWRNLLGTSLDER